MLPMHLKDFIAILLTWNFWTLISVFDFDKPTPSENWAVTCCCSFEHRERERTYSSDNKGTRRGPARQRGERRRRRGGAKLGDGGEKRAPEMRPRSRSNDGGGGSRRSSMGQRRENCSRSGAGSHGHSLTSSLSLSLSLSLCGCFRNNR